VLLNVDLGELPDEPEELYRCAHVANVACGGHAGDAASMRRAIALCLASGTRLGAHPSYPDRAGFGRARMAMRPEALAASVAEQCARLAAAAREAGAPIAFLKPHGALYHAAGQEMATAEAVVRAAVETLGAVTIIGGARSELAAASLRAGLAFAREGFADRGTRPDGTLVPRGQPGDLVTDPAAAAARARELAARGDVETVCVHGDTPGAVAIARAVREALDAARGAAR
jgi:UPF0271 protein